MSLKTLLRITVTITILHKTSTLEEGYLRYVKDGCFIRGEALACVKYKALKMATKSIFGFHGNETLRSSNIISFVPLDSDTLKKTRLDENYLINFNEPRGLVSEWAELTKYAIKLVTDFIKTKGLKISLPEEARAIEEEHVIEDGRGKKKKLAVIVPILTLVAAAKTKLLLIPVLLTVLFIKKLLLLAALLLPGLLHTLKTCKLHHSPSFFSHWGSADSADYNSDYGSSYAYSSNNNYGKDWAANRAYTMQKPKPSSMYMTAPGAAVV